MNKKVISIFTLLVFIIFSISCYSIRVREINTEADWPRKKARILSVVKTSGEQIEFSKDRPGRIYGDKITGTAIILSQEVEIDRADIKTIGRDQKGNIVRITNKDGKKYVVIVGTAREGEDKITFFTSHKTSISISIPLSEVKSVRFEKLELGPTLIVLVIPVVYLIVGIAYLLFPWA